MKIVQEGPIRSSEAVTDEPSLLQRVLRPRTLISFVIGVLILGFSFSHLQIDLGATWSQMRRANLLFLVLAFLVYYCTFPIRALRWRGMLQNAGCDEASVPRIPSLMEIIYLSWFANSVVPAKLGDVYRAYLLRRRSGLSFSRAGGTIVAERLIDLAVVLVLLGATGLWSFQGVLPPSVLTVLEIGSAGVLIAGVGLLLIKRIDPLIRRLVPTRLEPMYDHFQAGMLGSFGSYPRLLSLTVLAWLTEWGRLYLVTQSVGLTLSASVLANLLMVGFLALGAAFLTAPPGTPGGLGYVEASMVLALTLLGAAQPIALSVALLDRVISFASLIIIGFVVYLLSHRHS